MKLNDWNPVVSSLLHNLLSEGFYPVAVGFPGCALTDLPTIDKGRRVEALKFLSGVDESILQVKNNEGQSFNLLLVLGNEPFETVADYHCNDRLEEAIESFSNSWEGRSCPVIEVVG